jgi:hypothetical protein
MRKSKLNQNVAEHQFTNITLYYYNFLLMRSEFIIFAEHDIPFNYHKMATLVE